MSPNNRSWAIGIAAVFYFALGTVGLSLAIAPGYASPVFPAAGFAVAITLWSGRLAWPGIWMGSFALNLGVAWMHGDLGFIAGVTAAGIATGATLQALCAVRLVARSVGNGWQAMEQTNDVVRCLALAGPVSSLISASTGVTLLYLSGVVTGPGFVYSWWNWWCGDTLGVFVMLPLSLSLLYWNQPPWRGRLSTLVPPMLIAIGLVGVAFFTISQWEHDQQKLIIRTRGEALAKLLEQRFIAHQEALSALRRLIEVTPDMNYQQFEYFTRITLKDNPDIFALSVNPYVKQEQRRSFEQNMGRRTGFSSFEIRERDTLRHLVRAADRDEYVTVGYIAPLDGNRPAVGYDINSEPIRHEAIQRARKSGESTVTAPIQLVQENQQRIGVLLLHPAYRYGSTLDGFSHTADLMSFSVGVIKVDEMVGISTGAVDIHGIAFEIDDAHLEGEKALLYRSKVPSAPIATEYLWQTDLAMADRFWRLKVFPTPEFFYQQHHRWAFVVGCIGLVLAALLQMLLLVATGNTAIIQRKVREQTAELHAKSDALEDRNVQLNTLFSLSPDAFVAFAADGRIKFVNPAFYAMTGISPKDVVGRTQDALDDELRRHCDDQLGFSGVSRYFCKTGAILEFPPLTLRTPRHAVLQLVGVYSESSSVSRILYLREITHEAEVDRMKSEFLSHAAHELRTPMASIFGFSELLLEMDLDEATRRDLLETIHRQTKWLVDIINELLDLSRIETRRGKDLSIEEVDVSALLRDTVTNLAIDRELWPVILDLPARPRWVATDLAKLRQALMNVFDNARKYSPDGGEIRIAMVESDTKLGIVVSDNGIGMNEEQVARFGERFWRADTSGKTPGTGLGIAIVKEILRLLGGNIDIASRAGQGTKVTLWLPMNMKSLPDGDVNRK